MLYITATELRAALKEIEAAEANGFMYCRAILEGQSVYGGWIGLRYSDLWERAHPTNPQFDWGRYQSVHQWNRFENGKLVPLTNTLVGTDQAP